MTKFLIFVSLFGTAASAATDVHCDYAFMGAPMASIGFHMADDGTLDSTATVSMSGVAHQESITADTIADDEITHFWLSRESADNSIELIFYKQAHSEGQSVIINHHVPIGQNVWGNCQIR